MIRNCRVVFELHMFVRIPRHIPKLGIMPKPRILNVAKTMPRHLSMMALEDTLPKFQVPPLEQTMDKYLKAVRPLLEDEEFETTHEIVNEFKKKGGIGDKLQEKLLERARVKENWLAEWWDTVAYLDQRAPVVINFSPSVTFPKEQFTDKHDYLRYATRMVTNTLKFKYLIDNEKIPIDMQGKDPLNMYQYKLFLCSARIPQLNRDRFYVAPIGQAKHIVVMHKNQMYPLDVYNPDGSPMKESDILSQFIKITENTEPLEPPVGVLSSEDRNAWGKERWRMAKDRRNRANFELLDSAIIVINLDQAPAPSTQAPSVMEVPTDSVTGRQTLHGDGINSNSLNRWFDKPVQFIVSVDGHAGCCYEHTCAEAPTVGKLWDFVMGESKGYKSISVGNTPSNLPNPTKLRWNLKRMNLEAIERAKDRLQSFVQDTDVRLFSYTGYGKEFIKSQKLSPDGWIQVSLQLTFYRLHGHMPPTYETGAIRKFKLGRTDTIRGASIQAQEFAHAMTNKHTTNAERLDLMRKAIAAHSKYTKETINGNGIDRHLLGLKLTAIESGMNLPALFMDSTYEYAFHFKLSTSQVPLKHESSVVFGPAVPDGYGVCYNPQPKKLMFSCSSFNSNPTTNPGHFGAALQRSLDEMQLLCTTAKL